jgi:hypothetical protein
VAAPIFAGLSEIVASDETTPKSHERTRVRRAFLALPFQIRQCRRSTSATITTFACIRPGVSVDNPLAACFACCSRMAICNKSAENLLGAVRVDTALGAVERTVIDRRRSPVMSQVIRNAGFLGVKEPARSPSRINLRQ